MKDEKMEFISGIKEYRIFNKEKTSSFCVAPEYGGIITSLIVDGRETLYCNRNLLPEKNILAGGIPLLFPICGSLTQNRFLWKDKEYYICEHGFARFCPWNVNSFSYNEEKITLELKYNEETLQQFPFRFKCTMNYSISGNTLQIYQTVKNMDHDPMPFYSGFHPYFAIGEKQSIMFDIEARKYLDYNVMQEKNYSGKIDFDNEVDYVFDAKEIKSHMFGFADEVKNFKVYIKTSEEFGTMVLWAIKGSDFVCMEPWMAAPDAMNTGNDIQFVLPGQEKDAWVQITIMSNNR